MKAGFVSLGAAILLVISNTGVANAQSKVKGVDVSEYQGTIDWASVKSAGIGFGIARVSDGAHHSDAYFASNWSGMKKNGIIRGAYQFFRASQDPKAQAKVVADAVGSLGADDLPPVADVEVMDGVGAATLKTNLSTWCKEIESLLGVKPMIYTSPGFWDGLGADFAGESLWVANWFVSSPTLPSGWSSYELWQYSDSIYVSGISGAVDGDVFHGSMTDLVTFAHGKGTGTTSSSGSGGSSSGGASSGGSSSASEPTLTYGATGSAVKHLQELLAAKGYSTGGIDGVFGSHTEAAVKAFQKANGLTVDGIVGPHTWAALLA